MVKDLEALEVIYQFFKTLKVILGEIKAGNNRKELKKMGITSYYEVLQNTSFIKQS